MLAACGPVFAQWLQGGRQAVGRAALWEQNKDALLRRARRLEELKGPGSSADAARRSLQALNAVDAAFGGRGGAGSNVLETFAPLPVQVDLCARAREGFLRKWLGRDGRQDIWKNEAALRSNRLVAAHRVVREGFMRRMKRAEPAFLNAMERLPLWETKRLVRELIPPEAKYIFIGEYHDVPEIQRQVVAVAEAYHALYPQREIIFLSEYLSDAYPFFLFPEDQGFVGDAGQKMLEAVFMKRIKLAGLEERYGAEEFLQTSSGQVSMQVTLEGIRMRNAHWEQVIRAWRAKYPDAVFIIHGGLGHIAYTEPLAVSTRFPQKESFVLTLVPSAWKEHLSRLAVTEPFHAFTQGRFFTPGVIAWRDARFARLAGFDAQIILRTK